jgi:hypothetical protein
LKIGQRLKVGIDTIRRGVIAADMDLTTALRGENIDREMLSYVNQFRMLGMFYAVVTAAPFKKQHRRSLSELIAPELYDGKGFFIYADGGTLKARFNTEGELEADDSYTKTFSFKQVEGIELVLDKLLTAWRSVIDGIKKSGYFDEDGKVDTAKTKKDLMDSIRKELAGKKLKIFEVDIEKEIIKGIERLEMDQVKLSELDTLTFIDKTYSIDGKRITQEIIKDIYPLEGRKLLAGIAEEIIKKFNIRYREFVSLKVQQIDTSVFFTRSDADKSAAAKDLMRETGLLLTPDLVLAIDDEMAPEKDKAGFPFLLAPITVVSNERTEGGEKRVYPEAIKVKIKANWFWTGDYGLGYEVDATKNIFLLLSELYTQEVLHLCENNKIEPAIRRLKEALETGKVSIFSDGKPVDLKDVLQNLVVMDQV